MVGYGPEDNHFVVELTYNYTVNGYKIGNDFHGITIKSKETIERAKKLDWPMKEENELFLLESPDGYKFYIINEDQPKDRGIYFITIFIIYLLIYIMYRGG